MTSQREVAEAFVNGENSPKKASNFEMKVLDDGHTAYLIGGDAIVFAERLPIRDFTFYDQMMWREYGMWPNGSPIMRGYLSDQQSVVRSVFRRNGDLEGIRNEAIVDRVPPAVDEYDEL